MSLVKLNWNPSPKQLRQFGVIFLAGFMIIGLVKYFWPFSWGLTRDHNFGLISMAIGLVGGGLALTGTRAGLPLYYLWMGIAFVMGNVMSRVMIALIYYAVITPLSLLGRTIGRDRLQLRKPVTDTYWHDISLPAEPERYERQF
jgi:hypothetical protein